MLGPSSSALINLGARYPPCMKLVDAVPPTLNIACMNNTANPVDRICTIEDVCGFGGFHDKTPNQWFDSSHLFSCTPASSIFSSICLLS